MRIDHGLILDLIIIHFLVLNKLLFLSIASHKLSPELIPASSPDKPQGGIYSIFALFTCANVQQQAVC